MPDNLTGHIHSVETAGTVDGPGIRFVLFLTGCPLSCLYCHNPDCLKLKNGRVETVENLLAEIATYRNYLQKTKGGVTISGGEPLVQPAFTEALLRGCKEMGLHTALDTSGFLGHNAPDSLLEATDLVLLDIKSGLPDVYKRVTGVELQPTLDFAKRLDAMGKPVWARFVLVPGWTDGEDNIRAVADIIAPLSNVERVEVLPFHKMGEHKWEGLGIEYALKNVEPPSRDDTDRARDIFRRAGLQVVY